MSSDLFRRFGPGKHRGGFARIEGSILTKLTATSTSGSQLRTPFRLQGARQTADHETGQDLYRKRLEETKRARFTFRGGNDRHAIGTPDSRKQAVKATST